jgi:hypothetical protein
VLEELLLRPLADAFLQVGVAVAVLVAAVAWAQVRYGTRALDLLVRHRRAAPAVGALLGVLPGCGGAVLAAGLYLKRRASYGTAVAALTATMGDASFVLLAVDLRTGLVVHGVLLVTGLLTGYAVDALALDPRRERVLVGAASRPARPGPSGGPFTTPRDGAVATHAPDGTAVVGLPASAALLWLAVAGGSVLALPAALGLLDPLSLEAATGGVDLWLAVGVLGFLTCAVVFVRSGCRLRDDGDEPPSTAPEALAHGAVEIAFVVFWVAVAFVAVAVLGAATPVDGDVLPLLGVAGVVVGVLVALVPGCGTQIAFTGLYATGVLPMPALLANAVAQDGDALLPMLAQDRRAALFTTGLTSLPALVVGALALLAL